MDPRNRADETLARARARGAFVVTPDNATSPMDASNTVRIPREQINNADQDDIDPDSTVVLPYPDGQGQAPSQQQPGQQEDQHTGWPTDDYEQQTPVLPPNPYQAQRGANQFGPLGSQAAQQFPHSPY